MVNKEPSYFERALKSYINNRFLSGFRVLFQRKNLPFSSILFLVLGVNITAFILYSLNIAWMSDELLKDFVIIGFFIAIAMTFFSLLSAIWKNYIFQWIFIYIGILVAIIFGILLDLDFSSMIVQTIRSFLILVWIFIAVLSTFFIIVYFFTSLSGKIFVSGKSENHIFMGWIIRIAALGTFGLSGYIMYVNIGNISGMIVAVLGIICSLTILIYSWTATLDETTTNFITIMGLFNFSIAYDLLTSIDQSISNRETILIIEIVLFLFTALYYIQSKIRIVDKIETTRLDSKEKSRRVFFQQRVLVSEYSKKIFGEFSLVVMTIGITLGYSLVLLSLFINTQLPFSSPFGPLEDIGIPLARHRLSAIMSMLIFLISFILFRVSKDFRDFVTNKYSFTHGMKVLGDTVGAAGRRLKIRFERVEVRELGRRLIRKFQDRKERRRIAKNKEEIGENEQHDNINEQKYESSINSSETSINGKKNKKWKLFQLGLKKKND